MNCADYMLNCQSYLDQNLKAFDGLLSVRAESRLSEPQEVGQLAEKGCHELLLQNRGHAGCGRSGGGHGSEVGPVVAEVLLNQGKNNLGGHIYELVSFKHKGLVYYLTLAKATIYSGNTSP